MREVRGFSSGKIRELEELMPEEHRKFELHMRNFLAQQQTENFKLQKQITQLLRDKLALEQEIGTAEERMTTLQTTITGQLNIHPLDNVQVLEDLENEFK